MSNNAILYRTNRKTLPDAMDGKQCDIFLGNSFFKNRSLEGLQSIVIYIYVYIDKNWPILTISIKFYSMWMSAM